MLYTVMSWTVGCVRDKGQPQWSILLSDLLVGGGRNTEICSTDARKRLPP